MWAVVIGGRERSEAGRRRPPAFGLSHNLQDQRQAICRDHQEGGVRKRWREHVRYCIWTPLGGYIDRYGEQDFEVEEIIAGLSYSRAAKWEETLIIHLRTQSKYGKGYNLLPGERHGLPPQRTGILSRSDADGGGASAENEL